MPKPHFDTENTKVSFSHVFVLDNWTEKYIDIVFLASFQEDILCQTTVLHHKKCRSWENWLVWRGIFTGKLMFSCRSQTKCLSNKWWGLCVDWDDHSEDMWHR